MVVSIQEKDNEQLRKDSTGKKIAQWIARIVVLMLLFYLAAVLFNCFPLLPIYGATYLSKKGKEYLEGNISDLIKFYKLVYDNLTGEITPAGKVPQFQLGNNSNKLVSPTKQNASQIIKSMLNNQNNLEKVRDVMSGKEKHFFASIPITTALLKISEFDGIFTIGADYKPKDCIGNKPKGDKFENELKKDIKAAILEVEEDNEFKKKIVYDVNSYCNKEKIIWYIKQFFTLIGTSIGAMFMWPVYYLHETNIVQNTTKTETGQVVPCKSTNGGKVMTIIMILLAVAFIGYNAYSRGYAFLESITVMFAKSTPKWVLWLSIAIGVLFATFGGFMISNYRKDTPVKKGDRYLSQIPSVLSQPTLRGLITHFGLIKSFVVCIIGGIILGTLWNVSFTAGWMTLSVISFMFPLAGLILVYLTNTEMTDLFKNLLKKNPTKLNSSVENQDTQEFSNNSTRKASNNTRITGNSTKKKKNIGKQD